MNFWFEQGSSEADKEAHFQFPGTYFDAVIFSRLHATTVVDEEEGIENRRRIIGGRRANAAAGFASKDT